MKEANFPKKGRIAAGFRAPDPDWQTSQDSYRLPRCTCGGIELECRKEPKWLNCQVRISDAEEYTFRHPIPIPGIGGTPSDRFAVVIRWNESEICCMVDSSDIVTMPRVRSS